VKGARAAICAALVSLVLVVFAQVRGHEFVDLDDFVFVVHNPLVVGGLSGEGLIGAFATPHREQWTPLTWVSLQIDQELHGLDPGWVLLHNVALHATSTLLLFLFLAHTTRRTGRSAFVAAVFAIHPLHVESVAWATERKDVLSGFFWMFVLLCHARYAEHPSWSRYALVFLGTAAGLLAKPMVVTLPFVLLLLDFWPLRRFGWPPGRAARRALLEKLPLFAMAAGVAALTWWVQRTAGNTSYGEGLSLGMRLANAIDSIVFYLGKSLWPSGLAAFYPFSPDSVAPLRVAAGLLLLVAITLVALRGVRKLPAVPVGWLWFLGTLVPVIGLVQVGEQAHADRYAYLPMVGLSIALTWGAAEAARGVAAQRALALAGLAAVAALAGTAWVQVGVWRNSELLFEHADRVAPESGFVQLRLATLRLRAGDLEAAERHYRRFYELRPEEGRPRLVRFHLGRALQLLRAGDTQGAIARYRQALELDPEQPRASALLGLALLNAGQSAEARGFLEQALREWPERADLHASLARAAGEEGRFGEAADQYREALRLDPSLLAVRNDLAWLLATCPDVSVRDASEAVRLAEEVVQRKPGAQQLDTLAAAYAAAGRFDEAGDRVERAIELAEAAGAGQASRAFRERAERYARGDAWVEPAP
jgi:tetratricopeptide (TPR) repeat protein